MIWDEAVVAYFQDTVPAVSWRACEADNGTQSRRRGNWVTRPRLEPGISRKLSLTLTKYLAMKYGETEA